MTTTQVDFDGNEREPRQRTIRRLWDEFGGRMAMMAFAEELVGCGVYADDEIRALGIKQVANEARRVIKQKDLNGLPYACETSELDDTDSPIWITRTLMGFEDYVYVITKGTKGIRDDHRSLMALQRECQRRYGRAPEIPDLVDSDDATAAAN